jgi:hypothetical protein
MYIKKYTKIGIVTLGILCTGCMKEPKPLPITSTVEVKKEQRALNRVSFNTKVDLRSEKRTALVIGNGKYIDRFSLKNPTNDSQAMKEVLEKVGFKVLYGENVSKEEFLSLVNKFQTELNRNGGVGLFYYAGHGLEIENVNYLVPTNANLNDLSNVTVESIKLNEVLSKINNSNARLRIVFLDSCRNNPLTYRNVSNSGITNISSAKGMFITYATSSQSVAEDGKDNHGTFTKYLLKYIPMKDLDLSTMSLKVKEEVVNETNARQVPAIYNEAIGKFYFKLPDLNKNKEVVKPVVKSDVKKVVKPIKHTKTHKNYVRLFQKGKRQLERLTGVNWRTLKTYWYLHLEHYNGYQLPSAINKLTKLKYLYVNPNLNTRNLSATIKKAIGRASKKQLEEITGKDWETLETYWYLHLEEFTGERLPSSINKLSKLKYLYVRKGLKTNNLSAHIKKAIKNAELKQKQEAVNYTREEHEGYIIWNLPVPDPLP